MRLMPYREQLLPDIAMLQNRMNRVLERFFNEPYAETATTAWWPIVDMFELPETLEIRMDLPGIEAKDIEISVVGDALTITGERKIPEQEQKLESWFLKERTFGKFTRTIRLPVEIDADKVEAVDRLGVLFLKLPKVAEARARKIPVKLN